MADGIDTRRAALIAYDICRRALTPDDLARRTVMRPVLDVWVRLIDAVRLYNDTVIVRTPVSRADVTRDVVMIGGGVEISVREGFNMDFSIVVFR